VTVFAAYGNESLHHAAPGTQAAGQHCGPSGCIDSHARREDQVAGAGPDRGLNPFALALGSDDPAAHNAHAGFTRCGPQPHVKLRPVYDIPGAAGATKEIVKLWRHGTPAAADAKAWAHNLRIMEDIDEIQRL
jgi:hypothetical protein